MYLTKGYCLALLVTYIRILLGSLHVKSNLILLV